MQEYFDCLFSTNGLAYGTGVLLFLITLFLVSRHIIGFTLTLLFLVFTLVASFAVANKDLIRQYFENLSKPKTAEATTPTNPTEPKSNEASISEQLQKAYEDLKAEFEIQKKRFQSFLEEQRAAHEKPAEPAQPEQKP